MADDLIARASARIDAPVADVWRALTEPDLIRQYMFGTSVVTDWKPGGPITWSGEWQGKRYEDKGTVLEVVPRRRLRYTHFSPLAGLEDKPENYHTVSIELTEDGGGTRVDLSQDNNADETMRNYSRKNWETMLEGMKKLLEA